MKTKNIGCANYRRHQPTRRKALSIGALGALGGLMGLEDLLAAPVGNKPRKAKSVILLFQFGGPSHLDTFDPKPDAPAEIRGEFKTISTAIPGIRFSEHLPRLARMANQFALVRSISHKSSSHNPGAYYSLVGREPLINIVTLNASATDFPHPGSVLSYLMEPVPGVPQSVSLPTMIADGPFRTPGEFAGFLGKAHDPLWVLKDPNSANFRADDISLPKDIDIPRLNRRSGLFRDLDRLSRRAQQDATVNGMNDLRRKAVELVTSEKTRNAFDLSQETDAVRDRYGRTTYGQSCLLARRLVEAGVRFTTVYYSAGIGGWDTHKDNFSTLKNSRLVHTDQSVSALLEDLKNRGLLDETLVYWTGDFGRTPTINKDAGRDHWPPCQTIMMAGGGIRGGAVYGASNPTGAYPAENPLRPDDVTATVFHAMGLDTATEIRDQLGRPMPISAGKPILPIFG